MKALLIALAVALAIVGVQQYRILSLERDNAELQGQVKSQNAATQKAAADGKTEKAESDGRALEVKAGAAELKAKLPQGSGPDTMNAWYREVFP